MTSTDTGLGTTEPTPGTTTASSSAHLPTVRDERLAAIVTATAGAVGADPDLAAVQFTATGRATGWVATDVTSRQHAYVVDEPASLGGDDSAANPVEYALGALISCQVVTYRFWAARLGIRVDDVRITAVGDLDVRGFFGLDDAVRAGFREVRLEVEVVGPETSERYAELHAAVDAHCPVLVLFSNPTLVRTRLAVGAA